MSVCGSAIFEGVHGKVIVTGNLFRLFSLYGPTRIKCINYQTTISHRGCINEGNEGDESGKELHVSRRMRRN